jgi:hypothetical protein
VASGRRQAAPKANRLTMRRQRAVVVSEDGVLKARL